VQQLERGQTKRVRQGRGLSQLLVLTVLAVLAPRPLVRLPSPYWRLLS